MPNITGAQLARYKEQERELQALREWNAGEPFRAMFAHNLCMLLRITPWDQWPEIAKLVFGDTARKTPTGAALFKKVLPE